MGVDRRSCVTRCARASGARVRLTAVRPVPQTVLTVARIGILGGTFDPVHVGHLLAAHAAVEAGGLERVLLVPANRSPHKRAVATSSAADRLAMLRLSVAGDPLLEVSTVDVDRGGISYAIDTVTDLQGRYPGAELCFIVGMDCLRELHLWHRASELLERCTFLALARPGVDWPPQSGPLPLPPPWPERLLKQVIRGRNCEVSSSEIRCRVAEDRDIRYLVATAVEDYIRTHGLYRGTPHATAAGLASAQADRRDPGNDAVGRT